ncbi:hypothetical protein [Aliiruegeria lutimaris]|uniref:HdeA/HdeB family protein n=1 Tax=Aliiruegeria lutimaris TaxID=571298 RepID=A0A1G9DW51_9RHOB|nr:hypothetical protein [Aliiruegeria lutimaris]SDK68068.1 hypothetical protein SAMN04488026_104932 [Aliiruegeria lutimaris]
MKSFFSFVSGLALVASGLPVLAQTAEERAYQLAVDLNACKDLPILEAKFKDETETEVEVVCGGAGLNGQTVAIAVGGLLLLGLAAGAGGGGDGDSTSDTQ